MPIDEIDFDAINNGLQNITTDDVEKVTELPKEVVPEIKEEVQDLSKTESEVSKTEVTPEISEDVLNVANTVFENLQASLGLEFTEEDMEGIELTEDLDTVNKLAVLGGKKYGEKMLDDFLNSHPDYKKAFQYIQAHGSLSGIEETSTFPDYSKVDLSNDNTSKSVYRDYLHLRGMESDEIDSMIELAEDKGQLSEKAIKAQEALVNYYKGLETETQNKNSQIIQQREQERKQIVSEVSKVVNDGKILGINLSASEKKEFTDFLFKPVDKHGRSSRELYDEEIPLEQELYLEYLKFKRFSNVTPKVDPKVRTLRDLVAANKGRSTDVGTSKISPGSFNTSGGEIDFEELDKQLSARKNKTNK